MEWGRVGTSACGSDIALVRPLHGWAEQSSDGAGDEHCCNVLVWELAALGWTEMMPWDHGHFQL